MKKILFLFVLIAGFAFNSQAQTKAITLVSQYSATVDTVDNTETIYLSLPSTAGVAGFYKAATVVFKALEISGTGGGTATLQVSSNGTDFANAPVQYTADTAYTIVDQVAAQTYAWRLFNTAGKSYRIKITGSGTMSYKVYGSIFLAN